MEFTNEFRVSADIDKTFSTLIDVEKVAPCMPGATLEEADGDRYTGVVRVKVGPIQTMYRGTAEVVEIDRTAKVASIRARGKETRGTGTAEATITASLRDEDGETVVTVVSLVDVTGRPAQFGRGIMADVGEQIIRQFAQRLQTLLEQEPTSSRVGNALPSDESVDTLGEGPATSSTDAVQRRPSASTDNDALDLIKVAGPATLKRLAVLVIAVAAAAIVVWWLASQ